MEEARSFEVIFVRSGVFSVETRDGEHVLTPNELWVLPPLVPYRIRHPRGGDTCTILSISRAVLSDYENGRTPAMRTHRATPRLISIHTRLRYGNVAALEAEELVRETLETMSRSAQADDLRASHRRLARAAQELVAARASERLTLDDIARDVGSSPFHLSRIFRRATGQGLHRYQLQLRLSIAAERLAQGVTDLAGLALDLGFYDQSHFTNAFRRHFGQSPSCFRRSLD